MSTETVPLFLPPLDGPSSDEVRAAKKIIDEHESAVKAQMKSALVVCSSFVATGKGCGAHLAISDLVYLQSMHYVPPHGCTGGDYYVADEGGFECPKCGHHNRLYKSPDIEALKPYFREVQKVYRR